MKEVKAKIKRTDKLLFDYYGTPERKSKLSDPLTVLIGTILSQNTNDKNSLRAFQELRQKYPQWKMLLYVSVNELADTIRVAGLNNQKAKAIKNLIEFIANSYYEGRLQDVKDISIDFIEKLTDTEILDELTKLPGIGLKTASCVLLFSLDRNWCPVDTHVHRLTNRIGIVTTKTPNQSFGVINANMPPRIAHRFHTNLIKLGREICKSQKPQCSICPLLTICKYSEKNYEKAEPLRLEHTLLLDLI